MSMSMIPEKRSMKPLGNLSYEESSRPRVRGQHLSYQKSVKLLANAQTSSVEMWTSNQPGLHEALDGDAGPASTDEKVYAGDRCLQPRVESTAEIRRGHVEIAVLAASAG
jgi:hypothetical protein